MGELTQKRCKPCEGLSDKLSAQQVLLLAGAVPDWRVKGPDDAVDSQRLERRVEFDDFVAAMAFLNRVAELAEEESHHPDFSLHYNKVDFQIWTHALMGLSENDFILAAKIDQLLGR